MDKNLMTPQLAEAMMREILKQFSSFAHLLANKGIPELAPPFVGYFQHDGDIISFLDKMFEVYVDMVKQIDCLHEADESLLAMANRYQKTIGGDPVSTEFDILRDIKSLCKGIFEALVQYFKGFPGEAYNIMEKTFTDNECHLLKLLPQIQCEAGSMHFLRVRAGKKTDDKDLFHVPFELRHKTQNYRFSINGTPSLYCAQSLETCILENRIEPGSEITVAAFDFPADNGINVIDLTLPGARPLTFWEEYSLILFYPLIIACGLKVKHEDASFKQEYVIPQLFYQVLRLHINSEANIRGIAYVSTRYPDVNFSDPKMRNYVLFVRNCDKEKGYDTQIADMMTTSGPITFQYNTSEDLEVAKEQLKKANHRPIKL